MPSIKIPLHALTWLRYRQLSDKIINQAKLGWDKKNRAIKIPIYDKDGTRRFNKYRRDPGNTRKPKYWQDKGAVATLYGQNWLKDTGPVIVCEGEFDCLRLLSLGINAVTSTSGAGTFKQKWADELYGRQVYLIFDNDLPGLVGAQKAVLKFAQNTAQIVLLPKSVGNHGDISDYLSTEIIDSLLEMVQNEGIYFSDYAKYDEPKNKKEGQSAIRKVDLQLTALLQIEREVSKQRRERIEFNIIRGNYNEQKRKFRRLSVKRETKKISGEIAQARTYPIELLYDGAIKKEGGARLRALCPFHNERTPSFVIYKLQNSWYCYGGCGVGGDVIDYYMNQHNIGFLEAVKELNDL